jgi:hypothetical protein
MIPPLRTFYLEGLSKDSSIVSPLYKGLTNGNLRKVIGSKLRVVEALHLGPIKARFAEIGRPFGKSKGTIFKGYEKSQWQLRGRGLACTLSEWQFEAVGMFALEYFENGTPATYEAITHFIDSEMSISVSLDALRYILLRHSCLETVAGIPMEHERVELYPR